MDKNIIRQRLNSIIEGGKFGTVTNLSKKINVPQTTLSNCANGTEPRMSLLVSILTGLPNLSAEWLMRGEGSMWRTVEGGTKQAAGSNTVQVGHGASVGDIANNAPASAADVAEIARLRAEVESQKGEISTLRRQLAQMDDTISDLRDTKSHLQDQIVRKDKLIDALTERSK